MPTTGLNLVSLVEIQEKKLVYTSQFHVTSSDESEPRWLELYLELKDFQLGSAHDLFHFSSKIGRKRAEIRFSVEDLFLIIFYNKLVLKMTKYAARFNSKNTFCADKFR